ncbi:MAG: LysE family translocator [Desulfovibrionaceae bacterium]
MIDNQLLAYAGLAALLTLAPGADTMLIIRNVLSRGRLDGIITTVGVCSGLYVHATLSALGLSVILVHSATAFMVAKTLGACYLAWLGIQSLRAAIRTGNPEQCRLNGSLAAAQRKTRGRWKRSLREGFMCNVLNPKAAIFYLAILPQFINPGDPVLLRSWVLATIHGIMGLVWLCALSLFLGRMRGFVTRPSVQSKLEAASGLIMIGFGIRLALERR